MVLFCVFHYYCKKIFEKNLKKFLETIAKFTILW